jgi:hypothetical protein
MAVIKVENLEFTNEVNSFQDLTVSEVNATRGGAFWLAAVGAAWLGYSIAKEIKSHL